METRNMKRTQKSKIGRQNEMKKKLQYKVKRFTTQVKYKCTWSFFLYLIIVCAHNTNELTGVVVCTTNYTGLTYTNIMAIITWFFRTKSTIHFQSFDVSSGPDYLQFIFLSLSLFLIFLLNKKKNAYANLS